MSKFREDQESKITAQLVGLLYEAGSTTLIASQSVALILLIVLWGHVEQVFLYLWEGVFFFITTLRLLSINHWKSSASTLTSKSWANLYVMGALVSGVMWGGLIFFYDSGLPVVLQLFLVILLVSMPIAGLSSNAIYLPSLWAFSIPILLALLYWSLFVIENRQLEFVAIAVAYFALLSLTARRYNSNLRQSLEMSAKNAQLVEQLKIANAQLEKMAYYDPLTGLANRRWFHEQVKVSLERSRRHGLKLALLLVDLDNFKQVNDELGHEAGDQLLVSVAKCLMNSLRQTDTVVRQDGNAARYGGDEFVILLEDVDSIKAVELTAGRIINGLDNPVVIDGTEYKVTASVGIALFPDQANNIDTLMRRADAAMYRAKDLGGNQYCVSEPSV